jgi:hypothetical protein
VVTYTRSSRMDYPDFVGARGFRGCCDDAEQRYVPLEWLAVVPPLGKGIIMRNAVRGGVLVAALLAAPIAAATPSLAIPLEQPRATEQERTAEETGIVCTMQYPPSLLCLLASLSAA